MKLPNHKEAFVPEEKLTEYLISETHPVGSAKSKFFRGLGFNNSNIKELTKVFLKIADENPNLSFNSSDNNGQPTSIFQTPESLYKKDRENQENYEFTSNSYIFTHNLFN